MKEGEQWAMKATEITNDNYVFLQQHVHRESGIVLDSGKRYLMEARLAPIARKAGVESVNDLCSLIRGTQAAELRREVVDAMTTNETLFFRDLAPFEALKKQILPILRERNKDSRAISIWSAAASTGQEAYSIAMLLLEAGLGDWNLRILGTDLSATVLRRARQGRFLQVEVNRGLPAAHLVKYFERQGLEWQITERVRNMVTFEQFDLRRSMAGKGPFDVIFCRNVLIYFDMDTKRRILSEMSRTLRRGGHLALGAAETMLNLSSEYERVAFGPAAYYVKP
jgi:chemotaxis protein methyltransferase CheR